MLLTKAVWNHICVRSCCHLYAISHSEERLSEHPQTFESIRKEDVYFSNFTKTNFFIQALNKGGGLEHPNTLRHSLYTDTILSQNCILASAASIF